MLSSTLLHPTDQTAPVDKTKWVVIVVVASVCYLAVLSFINARGIGVSPAIVGMAEALIFAACLGIQLPRLPLPTLAFVFCAGAWVAFTWLIRQSADVKSARDLIIPILFLSLGRHVADVNLADRILKIIVGILVAVGLFEAVFTDAYASLFNTFLFYSRVTGISESAASFKGQMLSLNGYRPEGIGRTILPFILGSHRTSSVFLEPIALGNFAMILLAWVLSKSLSEIRQAREFILAVVLLVVLSDSRFGLLASAMMISFRCLPLPMVQRLAPTFPILSLAAVIGVAALTPTIGDNFLGRITTSGMALLSFDWTMLLGLGSPMPNFGDMGFAYLLSRFGAPLVIVFIGTLFLMPMADERGIRFRIFIMVYFFANIAISGTSVFALKTAGIMWFLFGVLCAAKPDQGVGPPVSEPTRVGKDRIEAASDSIEALRPDYGRLA
jgi:putative polymerase